MEKILNYIKPTQLFHDHSKMVNDVDKIIEHAGWGDKNQISLNSRPTDQNPWHDGVGAVTNRATGERLIYESDFTVWNDIPTFIKNSLLELQYKEKITFGRIRLMKLKPYTGLSVHSDLETRYHYVIQTNLKCYFGFSQLENQTKPTAICWHMPADGQWYHVDTTKLHFVYNGSDSDRIHIVVCAL